MNQRALLALTSHGNAPYLMAARFAHAFGNFPVVIPWYYGKRQSAILLEEIPQMAGQVYLSKELGDLFKPLLLESGNGRSFAEFSNWQANPANPQNARVIEGKLLALLADGISARSLAGEQRHFKTSDFISAVNTTLPVRVNLPNTIFFFTARMSRLYGMSPVGETQPETAATLKLLEPYALLWADVEATFDTAFIPRINAFSGAAAVTDDKIILTPPLAFTREISTKLDRPGILFVPSGTRTDLKKLCQAADSVPDDYQLLVLGSGGQNPDFPAEIFTHVNAEVYGDPHLVGVISRGGWGTIWECQANLKPAAVVQTSFVEDPEMGHSQATLTTLDLAVTIGSSIQPFINPGVLARLKNNLELERKTEKEVFGELAGDGFAYMATKTRHLWEN